MKSSQIHQGNFYQWGDVILECLDDGGGSYPRFVTVWPVAGHEEFIPPRQISRQLSEREAQVYRKGGS